VELNTNKKLFLPISIYRLVKKWLNWLIFARSGGIFTN